VKELLFGQEVLIFLLLQLIAEEGVSSVNAGATLSGWTEVKYNGTVLTNQLNDSTAKTAGQLVSLRNNGTWELADADEW
jgi:hypothetical protein